MNNLRSKLIDGYLFLGLFFGFLTVPLVRGEMPEAVLDAPESAYWHDGVKSWFVSNLGGGISLARDSFGWISRFDENGTLAQAKWVSGLDAPTGITSVGSVLYVVDRSGVVAISILEAKILRVVPLPDSQFPNDIVAAQNGDLYVSDMRRNCIYKITDGQKVEVWLESAELENPNGLTFNSDSLIVASWGPMIDPASFATAHGGRILKVDIRTKTIKNIGQKEPLGNLDGIEFVGSNYFVTDWSAGRLYKVTSRGDSQLLLDGLPNSADIGYRKDKQIVAIPLMGANRVVFLNLKGF